MRAILLALLFLTSPGARNDYQNPNNWLCRPGRADACSTVLTATVIAADGITSQRTYRLDPNAPIDCFYVYPTVSRESTMNSDMTAGPEQERAARHQFARFGGVCRLYAPLYRQVTLTALRQAMHGNRTGIDPALAYGDVLAAWNSYLAHDNHGRGVVLIGHSQGSKILARLIAQEIDGKPEQARLISAILPGTDIEVPAGRMVGGTFQHIPLCATGKQTGCVVAYSTYLATDPPAPDAIFGAASHKGSTYACVNPAELTGEGTLNADFPAIGDVARMFGTTFVENPGLLSAKCALTPDHSFLAITVGEGAASRRVSAALAAAQASLPGWGLHMLDVNLALGNLVDLVSAQSKEWLAARNAKVGKDQ